MKRREFIGAVLLGLTGSILGWARPEGTSDCADEVTLSRKGAKSRTRGRKLRSTGTKARTHVDRISRIQRPDWKRSSPRRWSSRRRPSEVLQRHLELARRAGAGVRGHAGERGAHLRGQVRHVYPMRGRRSARCDARCAACVCRGAAARTRCSARPPRSLSDARQRPNRRSTLPTSGRTGLPRARSIRRRSSPSSAALGPCSSCRCSRTTS